MLIIVHDLLTVHRGLQTLQPLLCAEAVVGLTACHQLLGILSVNIGSHTLRLYIGAAVAGLVRTLIRDQAGVCKRTVDEINRTLHQSSLVCILDPQQEIAALMLRNEISIKGCPQISHMHSSRR